MEIRRATDADRDTMLGAPTSRDADLHRFVDAQDPVYDDVVAELVSGCKRTHWVWFIFPQVAGLGQSSTARFFGIHGLDEATRYLAHPLLAARLVECTNVLLGLDGRTAHDIFGSPDDIKLRSSMTLFAAVPGAPPVFAAVLDRYFGGARDERTIELLGPGR